MYKDIFFNNNIPVEKIENEIGGSDGIVLPVIIHNERFYFKFVPNDFKERIEKEIEIVEELGKHGCNVPIYYSMENKKIFEIDNKVFYASKEVPGIIFDKNIEKNLLDKIIIEIAKIHKVLKKIEVKEEKKSDLDRLQEFYNSNTEFFKKYDLVKYIENILSKNYKEEEYIYIHSDINFRNIIVDENKDIYFIDFTDMRVGYLEDDLGKIFQNILYLDLTKDEIYELIKAYERELNYKINIDNLILSIVFRIIYRYFCFVNNKEGNIEEYDIETKKVLKKISVGGV